MDGRAPADFPKTAKLLSLTGKATQEGLSNAQQQPFVAELEALLEDAASKNADAVKDLLPTLRFLSDSSSTPWLGLQNYLAKGGSVRVLNTALGFRGEGVSQIRPDLVGQAMEMMKDWSPQAVRGLEALERLNATARGKGRKYANLFLLRSEDPKGVAAALESLAILEPKIDTKDPASLTGVRKVLGALSAEDTPMQVEKLPSGQTISKPAPLGSAPNITGAVGALRAGAALSRQFASPDVFIRFEVLHEVINEATGEVLGRAYDIEVLQRHAATGKGLPPPDTVLRRAEVKEVSSAKSLSTPRVLKEFATDILHDIQLRTAALNAGQPAPGPLQDTVSDDPRRRHPRHRHPDGAQRAVRPGPEFRPAGSRREGGHGQGRDAPHGEEGARAGAEGLEPRRPAAAPVRGGAQRPQAAVRGLLLRR